VMSYVRGCNGSANLPDSAIAHSARIAAELGADIIKTPVPKDYRILKEITSGLPVPVVVAGGSKIAETTVFLDLVEKAMAAGAQGVAIGRNIFQSRHPELLLRAICRIVHRGSTAGKAWEEATREGLPEPAPVR
jgi:DhnA family fructose-bisphosphate aldolase class Ia